MSAQNVKTIVGISYLPEFQGKAQKQILAARKTKQD